MTFLHLQVWKNKIHEFMPNLRRKRLDDFIKKYKHSKMKQQQQQQQLSSTVNVYLQQKHINQTLGLNGLCISSSQVKFTSWWTPTWRLHTNLNNFWWIISWDISCTKYCFELNLSEGLCMFTCTVITFPRFWSLPIERLRWSLNNEDFKFLQETME